MIVLLMIGVLACLTFLCVSPIISLLGARKAGHAAPSKPRPIQKQTSVAR